MYVSLYILKLPSFPLSPLEQKGETPFKCEICKKRFKQKNAWKNHLKIHCINNVPPRTETVQSPSSELRNHREQKNCYNTTTTRKQTRKKQSLNDCHLQTQHTSEKHQIVEKIVSHQKKKQNMPFCTNNNLCSPLNGRMLHHQNSNQQTSRTCTITQPFTGNKCGNAFADDYNSIQNDLEDQNQTWTTNPFLDEIRSLSPINPYFPSDYSMFDGYNNMELSPMFTSIDTMSENVYI